ncbi:MAG: J domain-containing protein [Cyanobacteria bacterium J06638_22]
MVLACDRWLKIVDNTWAIAKHVEALRGQERWGVGTVEQAFAGYAALPSGDRTPEWWEVLGCNADTSVETIKAHYRGLVKRHHPDVGGDRQRFEQIQGAYQAAIQAVEGDRDKSS